MSKQKKYEEQSITTWGDSPTGTTFMSEQKGDTRSQFLTVIEKRDFYEMSWLRDMLSKEALRGKKALEVGTGPGYDAKTLIELGANYFGIDLTPQNIKRANANLQSINLNAFSIREGNAIELPFENNSFDFCFSNGVLHHVYEFDKTISEVFRVLKPGGRAFITLYNKKSIFYKLMVASYSFKYRYNKEKSVEEILSLIEYNGVGGMPLVRVFDDKEITRILEKEGFVVDPVICRKATPFDFPLCFPDYLVFDKRPKWLTRPLNLLDLISEKLLLSLPQRFFNFLGTYWGWYLVCRVTKPLHTTGDE
ncbi:class I SAM-dependent methyltransferase [Terasakiella pusilla]|uniref:class I SAM-dependent methyltransferase n=1 Tax=Terasakiella pusilla TaxID=64973 RepID=UPI000691C31D|nr:class I SAM-dependent methyltransferase [Terasakiella pusilla]